MLIIRKLKKIIKLIFFKKKSSKLLFEDLLKQEKLIAHYYEDSSNRYVCKLRNGLEIIIRGFGSSDYEVFKQIFINKEYEIVLKIFELNNVLNNTITIIDAGANVGFTSLYFMQFLKKYKIIAVEPSKENYEIILENTKNSQNFKVYQNALTEKSDVFFNINRDFRDGKDWSISTKEDINGQIEGITLNQIIKKNEIDKISLLKIDIEGAERFIFNKINNLEFLKITLIIAIEIHDEYAVRNTIIEILQENNFFLIESGELTIGVNKTFLD